MSVCTQCGFKTTNCGCSKSPNVQFEEISYTNTSYTVPSYLIKSINDFKAQNDEKLDEFTQFVDEVDITPTNVRIAYIWSVCSIQTDTPTLDELTSNFGIKHYGDLKDFLEDSTDSDKKWEKVLEFWNSDLPERVADLLKDGEVVEAQAVMCGLKETHDDRNRHYIRPTKANMITWLLGDTDSLCFDSRRHRCLKPLLSNMLPDNTVLTHVDTNGPYKSQTTNMAVVDSIPAHSLQFLQDRLFANPYELRSITTEVLDTLEAKTTANRREIVHITFCLAGETTFHESLQDLM